MLRPLSILLALLLGVLPVMDELDARLRALESETSALRMGQSRLIDSLLRQGRARADAADLAAFEARLQPGTLDGVVRARGGGSDRTPALATPLLQRLMDDPGLAAAPGRMDLAGYANILLDPTFDTLGASPVGAYTTIGTSYTAISPRWEAKYVLNSGTVATTRSMGRFSGRGDTGGYGYGVGSSGIAEMDFVFGVNASDMTIYLRPSDTSLWSAPLPSWLVASMRAWLLDLGGGSTPDVPATAYLEIVDGTDAVVASGDAQDLMNLLDLNEVGLVEAALEAPSLYDGTSATRYRPRLRIDLVKAAGSAAQTYILLAEPLLAGSDDGSVPVYTPAIGTWWPGAPGRQLVLRTYAEPNIAAGATTTMSVTANGFPVRVPEVFPGSIVGVGYRWLNAITGGTHSIIVQKNSSNVWTAFSGASAQSDQISQPPFVDTFVTGDLLSVDIVTGGGFLPDGTNDLVVDLYLLLDYDGI